MSWPTKKHEIVKGYYFKQFMQHSIVHHKNSCKNKNCKFNNYFCSFWRIPHSVLLSLLLLEVIHHFIITKTILISEYTCQRALVQMEIPPSIKNGVESKVLASIPTELTHRAIQDWQVDELWPANGQLPHIQFY